MERIKDAIAKAKAEQSGAAPTPAASAPVQPLESHITYSQTRIVTVSRDVFAQHKLLPGLDDDDARTAYKILRTRVAQRMTANGWNALAVTSPGPGEGKTLTALNLAIGLALEMHRTVLLADFDLRNPSVHRCLGQPDGPGIVDYLTRDVPLSSIMFNPGIERLVVLPGAAAAVPQSSELLASPKMAALVNELKTRYPQRFVIFDLPPVLATDDALAFAPYVDCSLLVVDDGKTTRDEVNRSIEILRETNLLGTVLNNCAVPPQHAQY